MSAAPARSCTTHAGTAGGGRDGAPLFISEASDALQSAGVSDVGALNVQDSPPTAPAPAEVSLG